MNEDPLQNKKVSFIVFFLQKVKNEIDLRNRIKKSLKNNNESENDQVTFTMPKFDIETDEVVLNR